MILNQLHPAPGARKKNKRLGRGSGSGHGKTSGRGNKGLFSRSGGGLRHGFEGGQMPLIRRIPKRGFLKKRAFEYQIVNIGALCKVKNNGHISPKELKASGLIKKAGIPVKILGGGKLSGPVTVKAHAFSASAARNIESAGGKIEILCCRHS